MNALDHVNCAYSWISKVYVNDMSVDFLAMARQELRKAQEILVRKSEEESDG